MKIIVSSMGILFALLTPQLSLAEAPAGAPAGTTALCNDGTYSKATTRKDACISHKGVKTWYGTTNQQLGGALSGAQPGIGSGNGPIKNEGGLTTTAPPPAKSTGAAAPGGRRDLVWLDTTTKVYHCYGNQHYGKTKNGEYMTAAQARAKGGHLASGDPCK